MSRIEILKTVFTAEIPEVLDDGILYISRECCVALHNCACGCGEEVSTPLVTTEYRLTMHGDMASLWPSIGNHDFACRSHYVIDRGKIVWADKMSRVAIQHGRVKDRLLKRPLDPSHAQQPRTMRSAVSYALSWMKGLLRKIFG
jgi:hypothetical protein